MKLFKNLFSTKPNEISKYEPNTLAEINESPDPRKTLADEKIEEKQEKNIKEAKKSNNTSQKNKITKPNSADKAVPKKATAEAKPTAKPAAKKTATETKTTAKKATAKAKPTAKSAAKKTATETKTTAKKATAEAKPTAKPVAKKTATEAKTTAKETTAEAKPTAKPAAKKTAAEAKPTPKSTTNKAAAEAKSTAKAVSKKVATADKKDNLTNSIDNTSKDDVLEVTEVKSTRTGKFEIKKSKDGRYVFNLYASNKVIVATSQVYSSSSSAMNGIKSVIANAGSAPIEDQTVKNFTSVPFPKWEIYRDKGDQYRFRLCASNGSCVCHSQGYTSKTNCKKGIESIIKFAGDAEITKAYINNKDN